MENSTKALLIAGAMLLCILIIAVGMFIFNSASGSTNDAMSSMSTNEIDVFNKQFDIYEGLQTGAQIKTMIGILIGNANTNRDEPVKIPGLGINKCVNTDKKQSHAKVPEAGDIGTYIEELGKIRNRIDKKHEYWVELSYQSNGLIDYITITYDADNPEAVYTREHLDFSNL